MKKDIFIDNSIASKHFSNPIDDEFKKLIEWIQTYNSDEFNDAYLVISPFLIKEYVESNRNANSTTNIVRIIDDLTKQDRLIRYSKKEIEVCQKEIFTKKILKKLQSNSKDRNHIPAVLLSDRKIALTEDNNFIKDLNLFEGIIVDKRPENIPYSE
jgi:hypothetical protein